MDLAMEETPIFINGERSALQKIKEIAHKNFTKEICGFLGFDKKQDAKAKRNELCKEAWQKWSEKDNKDKNKPFPYVVTKGKEHPRLIWNINRQKLMATTVDSVVLLDNQKQHTVIVH